MALHSGKSTRLYQWGPGSNPCVETTCGLSLLLVPPLTCSESFFLWVVRFSLLLKNQHFQILYLERSDTFKRVHKNFLSASWVNKLPLQLQLQTALIFILGSEAEGV